MIQKLYIENYILIKKLEIDFDSGFTCITGETGAGKSILLGAINLILGHRADTNTLLDPEQKCIVEAVFDIENYNLKGFFSANDIDFDNHTTIRREITPQNKSRAFINDTPVNLNVLRDLVENLVDIHSQFQTLKLQNNDFQIQLLDSYAQNSKLLAEYSNVFNNYTEKKLELKQKESEAELMLKEFEYNSFLYEEISALKLIPNEVDEIETELKQITHAEEVKTNLYQAINLLYENEDSVLNILQNIKNLTEQAGKYNDVILELSKRINSCHIELNDISSDLLKQVDNIFYDEDRHQLLTQRLNSIYNLLHKHKVQTTEQLIEIEKSLEASITSTNQIEETIKNLKTEIKSLYEDVSNLSEKLSESRKTASASFEKQMLEILPNLGMKSASFSIEISTLPEHNIYGKDEVSFLFSANKGHEVRELSKVASGGEMSRLMLAIKSLSVEKKMLPTIIFDEIDTGISGEIAAKAGMLMCKMAENKQIVAITHLPQIAGLADSHFKVYKTETDDMATTEIKKLNQTERINEIAGLISDGKITQSTIEAAKHLLTK